MAKKGGAAIEFVLTDTSGIKNLEAVARQMPKLVAAGLAEVGERIMRRSKESFVPVDDGPLRASGRVSKVEVRGDTISVFLSYNTPYALAVHEHLSQHSPASWRAAEHAGRPVQFSPGGTGPKYLERPLMEAVPTIAQQIADAIRRRRGLTG